MRKVNETPEETIKRLNIPKVAAKADIKQQGRLETKGVAVTGLRVVGWPGSTGGQDAVRPGTDLRGRPPASAREDEVPGLTGAW